MLLLISMPLSCFSAALSWLQEPAPLQLQLPRLRRLLSLSDQFVALVDDPDKVAATFSLFIAIAAC